MVLGIRGTQTYIIIHNSWNMEGNKTSSIVLRSFSKIGLVLNNNYLLCTIGSLSSQGDLVYKQISCCVLVWLAIKIINSDIIRYVITITLMSKNDNKIIVSCVNVHSEKRFDKTSADLLL